MTTMSNDAQGSNKGGTMETDVDVIDIEEHSKSGEPVPQAAKYIIRIDKQRYELTKPTITGRELLNLAGKQPVERFASYQKRKGGGTERVALDQSVDVRAPGVERFVTLPLDQTEGIR